MKNKCWNQKWMATHTTRQGAVEMIDRKDDVINTRDLSQSIVNKHKLIHGDRTIVIALHMQHHYTRIIMINKCKSSNILIIIYTT